MAGTALPPELISLVHHVELNKAGWWSKAIQRFVMGTVWLSGRPLRPEEITQELHRRSGTAGTLPVAA